MDWKTAVHYEGLFVKEFRIKKGFLQVENVCQYIKEKKIKAGLQIKSKEQYFEKLTFNEESLRFIEGTQREKITFDQELIKKEEAIEMEDDYLCFEEVENKNVADITSHNVYSVVKQVSEVPSINQDSNQNVELANYCGIQIGETIFLQRYKDINNLEYLQENLTEIPHHQIKSLLNFKLPSNLNIMSHNNAFNYIALSKLQCEVDASNNFQISDSKKSFILKINAQKFGNSTNYELDIKPFSQIDGLKEKQIANLNEGLLICEICKKSFYHIVDLWKHILPHHNDKIYLCGKCDKFFLQKNTYSFHLLSHSKSSSEKPFVCKICGASFATASALKKHILSNSNVKEFAHDKCGRFYRLRGTLNKHIAPHSLENPCRKFLNVSISPKVAKLNKLSHHKEKPFSCKSCKKEFATKAGFILHRLNHPDETYHSHLI